MNASKAVKKAAERGRVATKKAFPPKQEPTKRELILSIRDKMDRIIERMEAHQRKMAEIEKGKSS